MQLYRLQDADQQEFGRLPEVAMDCHLAQSEEDFYLVIGDCVGILLNERTLTEPDNEFVRQPWLVGSLLAQERVRMFANWLERLETAPNLSAATPAQAWRSLLNAFSPVAPIGPLPLPLPRSKRRNNRGFLAGKKRRTKVRLFYRWTILAPSSKSDREQ